MTEPMPSDPIDLRALDDGDAARVDRVMAVVLSRIGERSPSRGPWDVMAERFAPPALAAAALLVVVAAGAVMAGGRTGEPDDPTLGWVARWVQADHVPTNGELLLAFQGYQR